MNSIYTRSERTVPKYTVGKAVSLARARLGEGVPMCMNAINRRPLSDKITLEEVNRIADEIVGDSRYYNDYRNY